MSHRCLRAILRGVVGVFSVFFFLSASSQQAPAAGIFSTAYLGAGNFDASIGLSTSKTYLTAVNFNGSQVTINGVPFAASSGGNPSGTDYSISGIADTYSGFTSQVTGGLGTLLSTFIYNGSPGVYSFSGLTAGQTYVITYYGSSWEAAGARIQNLTTSDGATGVYDVDMDAPAGGYGNLLRYTFVATGSTESITATPQVSGYTLHTYGLSLEQTFNNTTTPSGNTNWSALTWSNGTAPNGPDTNAYFSPASAHTTITLDTPATLGYLQFAGTNSYLLSGTNTLTMQADMGGTALLNASDGSHTISTPIVLNSTAAQLGGGTLTLNGGVSGTGGLSVGNGLLVLTTSNNYSGPTTAITGGTLALLNANPFPNSTLTMSGGAVVFDSSVSPKVFNIGGLAGTSNLALQDNAASPNPVKLNVGGNGAATIYTGLLSGAGTLNVVGPGALTLATSGATSNLAGGIVLSGGTLNTTFGALSNTVSFAGGTLQFANTPGGQFVGANMLGTSIKNSTAAVAINANGQTVVSAPIDGTNTGGLNLSGGGMLVLTGASAYQGATTVSSGTLSLNPGNTSPGFTIANANFDTPNLGNAGWSYNTAGGIWNFTNGSGAGSGLAATGSPWVSGGSATVASMQGNTQACFLQDNGFISQSVTVGASGYYNLSFLETNRPGYGGYLLALSVDGSSMATWSAATLNSGNTVFQPYDVTDVYLTAGTHTLEFQTTQNPSGADTDIAITNIGVSGYAAGSLPTTTVVNLSTSAAVLNLSGLTQTIGSLTGVAGSTVVDTGTLISGNDNTNATFAGTITGSGAVTKIGSGIMFLNGPNTYTGLTTVSSGTLAVGPSGSLPSATTLTDNATVSFNNSSQSLTALASSGSVTLNGTTLAIIGPSAFSGTVSGNGTLMVSGGSLTLTGNNASAVPTTANNGTLVLSNAGSNNIAAATPVTVTSSGTLDVTGLGGGNGITLASGQTLRGQGTVLGPVTVGAGSTLLSGTGNTVSTGIGTLTFMSNLNFASGATLATYLGTPGTSSTSPGNSGLISVQGNVTLPSSGLNLSLLNNSNLGGLGSAGNGYYDLINYTGTLIGTPSSAFSAISGKTLEFYVQNNQLDMYVAISNLNWTGVNADGVTANSSWDTTTTSTNWANLAPSSTTAAAYQDGSNVTFADKNALNNGAITTSNITIQSQGVQPNSITFDNNTVNYTFNNAAGGTVGIGGATGIVKSGSGAVYLQGANTFQGPVSINGGIINVANSAGLGASSGVTVASGAALQLQGGVSLPSISLSLAGSLDSVSGVNSYPGSVTLTAPAAIDTTAGLLTLGGAVSNGGYALTIGGAGTTTMSGPGISGNGGLTVNAGATLNLAGTMSTSGSLIDNGSLNLAGAAGVNGTLLVAGTGSVSSTNSLAVGFQAGGVGAAFQNGGAVTVTGAGLYVGVAGGTGAYNITAGTVTAGTGTTFSVGGLSGSSGTGTLNVNGGLVQALGALTVGNGPTTINLNGGILQTPAWTGGTNSVALNLNGGTLQANSSLGNYLAATSSASISVYAGGAVIDTNGNNISIYQPLGGVANSGITSISLVRTSTTVFTSPPAVTFSGGSGSGATAYATLSSSGKINGIVVTNPGSYTVAPTTITVAGATGLGLTPTLSSNSNGGLTKNGAGILSLGGVNTYGGPTVINAGTLQLANIPSVPAGVQAVAFYPMNGPLGAVAAGASVQDTVNGLNGTLQGTGASYVAGNFPQGPALQLNGTSNYVTVPYNSALGLSNYTFSTWLDVTAPPAIGGSGPGIISTRNGGDETFDLQLTQPTAGSYQLHGDIGSGSAWLNTAANSSTFGALSGWNMVTYTVNSTADTYAIYLNGSQIGGGTFGGTALLMKAGQTLSFASQEAGGTSYGNAGYLSGAMEATGIYNGAMTAAQVQSLYASAVGLLPTATSVTLASGATFDLNGANQQVASLQNGTGGGGTVTNSSANSATLTLTPPSGNYTFGGTITNGSAPLNLVLNGNFSATQVLSGSNTFTGTATVADMTLVLANSAAMLNATLNATQGGQILFDPAVGAAISLGGLSGDNTVTIGMYTDSPTTPLPVALTVGSNGQNTTFAGTLSDNGMGATLTKVGNGILTLLGSNSYTGATFINGGELGVGDGAIPSGGIITFGGGALQYAASNTTDYSAQIFNSTSPIAIDTNGLNVTFATPLDASNTGGLTKLGAGILSLTAANAYSGTTTIAAGELSVGNVAAIPASSTITFTGGALQYTAANTLDYSAQIHNSTEPIALDTNGLTVTISGVLDATNSGGLTKLGAGTLVLANANLYSGTTTVAAGVLQLANQQGIPDFGGLAVSGGTLDLNGYTNKTLSVLTTTALSGGVITSSAPTTAVTLNLEVSPTPSESVVGTTFSDGAGTLALTIVSTSTTGYNSGLQFAGTNNTYSGGTTINNSYARVDNPTALGTGTITVSNSGFVELWWNTGSQTMSNNWVLETLGGNQYGSQAAQKSAIFADGGGAGYGSISGGTITGAYILSGSITLASDASIDAYATNILEISGPISGPGQLYKGILGGGAGGGLVVLTNTANSYQGGTTLSNGTLGITADSVLGPASGGITFAAPSTLEAFANNITIDPNRSITISTTGAGAINVQNFTMSIPGSINGVGGLTVAGGTGGILVLGSANGYLGGTNINGAVLNVNNAAAIPGQVSFGGGTLQYTVNSYQVDYSGRIFNSAGPIAIDTNGQTVTFSSGLDASNVGGLTKIGQGTLVLSGFNAYSGTTTIAGGVLNLASPGAIPSTSNITFAGGTLQYAASNNDYSAQIVNSTGPVAIDTNGQNVTFASPLAASNNGGLNKIGAGMLTIGAAASYSGPTVVSGGTLQLAYSPPLLNGNMASPTLAAGSFIYYSAMSPAQQSAFVWSSSGNGSNGSGALTTPNSAWGYATPYPGPQAFSLQQTSYLGQTLNLAAGTYTVSWSDVVRPGDNQSYEFLVDGSQVGSTYTADASWSTENATFTVGAGSHTIAFLGLSPVGNDNSVALTNVAFDAPLDASLPSSTALSIAASAAFDLNGDSQTVASLSGAGSMINSTQIGAALIIDQPAGGSRTFSGTISDNGPSNNPISLTISGNGTQVLAGSNTYSGTTTITGGVLQAVDGVGLPSTSNLIFAGSIAQSGAPAVLQSSGSFTRALGTAADQVQWMGDGGFAANGGPLTVSIPNGGNPLAWGSTYFVPNGNALTFGSATANAQVNFTNSIDLSGGTRQIYVAEGTGGDSALISGNIVDSVGGAALLKTGAGELILSGSDAYTGGTTVEGGVLMITTAAALPTGSSLAVGAGGTFIFDPTATAAPVAGYPRSGSAGSAAPAGVAAVPEPGALALLAVAAMVGCGIWRRRR